MSIYIYLHTYCRSLYYDLYVLGIKNTLLLPNSSCSVLIKIIFALMQYWFEAIKHQVINLAKHMHTFFSDG